MGNHMNTPFSAMVKVKGFEAATREQVGESVWINDVEKIMITP